VVMLDPPYSDPSLVDTLRSLLGSPLVGEGSTIVVQSSSHKALPPDIEEFHLSKSRHYGDTCVSIYQKEVQH